LTSGLKREREAIHMLQEGHHCSCSQES
jgi:hypothetical protein